MSMALQFEPSSLFLKGKVRQKNASYIHVLCLSRKNLLGSKRKAIIEVFFPSA